jgi:hypothetical protein
VARERAEVEVIAAPNEPCAQMAADVPHAMAHEHVLLVLVALLALVVLGDSPTSTTSAPS